MGSWILRILLFLICGISGVALTQGISPSPPISLLGLIAGFLLAALTLLLEKGLKKIPLRNLLGSFIGLIRAILIANLFSNVFFFNLINYQQIVLPLLGALYGVFGYIGLRIGFKKGEEIHLPGWNLFSKNAPPSENSKILDTSVIIDGRIADITECKGKLEVSADEAALVCNQCRLVYPVENDIPALMVSAAKKLD